MRYCPLCQKKGRMAGGYSNRTRATKFNPTGKVRKNPNLQWATLSSGNRMRICAKCLRSLNKV